jgi:hypothetical protein
LGIELSQPVALGEVLNLDNGTRHIVSAVDFSDCVDERLLDFVENENTGEQR